MNKFKKTYAPLIVLILSILVSCFYIIDTAKTKKEIVFLLQMGRIERENKIDSLEYENLVKDIIIFDSISVDTILELEITDKTPKY